MFKKIKNWFILNLFILNTAKKMDYRLPKIIDENNKIMNN